MPWGGTDGWCVCPLLLLRRVQAFTGYLGSVDAGKAYDATELAAAYAGPRLPMLVDQGADDGFLEEQLKPKALEAAVAANGSGALELKLRMQEGYDHSYYFIATFIEDHINLHADQLLS